ncbi:putative pentatricopeptide [Medicago truncatula]|uniref:Putative pentatricopeptide n=1 Tax=Medicago truncatula TaxID=3880 RepID=A0A396IQW5_MEDTR|nr:putative pentatricopeptide [Medicago truncatula]
MKIFGVVCESVYSSMITIYTRLRLFEKAESVVELMEREVMASNMDGAEGVFLTLGGRIEPDETSYRSMIEGWGRAGNYEKARWYYEELKR